MSSLEEKKSCERAATDVKLLTSVRLAVLEKQMALKKENGYSARCNCSRLFNETALGIVFDAIHHSAEYSNSVSEMELFREELLGAVDKLSRLINARGNEEERKHSCCHADLAQH